MLNKIALMFLVVTLVGVTDALAQTTGVPSFNAPYRSFAMHEFGGTLSFVDGGGTAIEGQYRFGMEKLDVGVRGGFLDPDGPGDTRVLLGAVARQRVITQSVDFPLDGAVVVGIGAQLVSGGSTVFVPVGLSLGRRVDLEDSPISIVPYAQPTLYIISGDNKGTDLKFAFGFGADVRLSRLFDLRVSFGLGDLEGVAVSAIWIR